MLEGHRKLAFFNLKPSYFFFSPISGVSIDELKKREAKNMSLFVKALLPCFHWFVSFRVTRFWPWLLQSIEHLPHLLPHISISLSHWKTKNYICRVSCRKRTKVDFLLCGPRPSLSRHSLHACQSRVIVKTLEKFQIFFLLFLLFSVFCHN